MDNLNKVLDKTNSTKKSVPKIPKKLKEGLMKKLHVSGEDIEATLSSFYRPECVTPFTSYTDEMCETFKADQKAFDAFNKAKDFAERFELCYHKISSHPAHRNIKHLFPDQVDPRDLRKSQLSYDEAEEFLDDGQYEAALDKFSESMLLSPVKVKTSENKVQFQSPQLRLAAAGRAKVFFEIENHYQECLEDIETAMLFDHSEDEALIHLYELQMECFIKLGRKSDARDSLEMMALTLKKSKLYSDEEFLKLIKTFQKKIIESEKIEEVSPDSIITLKLEAGFKQVLPRITNQDFKNSSSTTKFLSIEKEILPGEIMFVESPSTWYLSGIRCGTNCHVCCEPLVYTLIPSPFQPRAIFCSIKCFHKAISTDFHYQESKFDLRAIFELTSHSLLEQSKRNTNQRLSDPDSIAAFLTLRTFIRGENLLDMDFKRRNGLSENSTLKNIMQVIFILKLLNILEKNGKTETNKINSDLLQKAIQISKLNSTLKISTLPIYQSEKSLIPGHPLQLNEIGSAVYPKLFQIVSHSCDPNCIKIFRGNQIVLIAKRVIPSGTPLTISYGPHFSSLKKVIRQAQLQAFFSISCCKCLACEKNYPLLSEISDDLNGKSFGKGKNPFRLLKAFEDEAKSDHWVAAHKFCCKFLTSLQDLQLCVPDYSYEAGGHALSCASWKVYGNCLKPFSK